jgi:lycopene cyclase domain-containing protein
MTYLQFLLLFVISPTLVLLVLARRSTQPSPRLRWRYAYVLGLAVVAFAYATPWDNYLIYKDVWAYGDGRVMGVIGFVPIEEYMFFVLQVLMTGFWTLLLHDRFAERLQPVRTPRFVWLETVGFGLLGVAGLISFLEPRGLYFALIAVWAAPVCIFQWWYAPRVLARSRKLLAAAIIPPSLYLCLADLYAIRSGIWSITDATRSGLEIVGLPVEEALFFTITNVMVVQGLVLLLEREKKWSST